MRGETEMLTDAEFLIVFIFLCALAVYGIILWFRNRKKAQENARIAQELEHKEKNFIDREAIAEKLQQKFIEGEIEYPELEDRLGQVYKKELPKSRDPDSL